MEQCLGPSSTFNHPLHYHPLNPSLNPRLNCSPPPPNLPTHRFFATCAPGLEEVVSAELSHPPISASDVAIGSSGVSFSGTLLTAYNANLWLRSAVRVLVEIASSPLSQQRKGTRKDPIYEFVRECVDWKEILAMDDANRNRNVGDQNHWNGNDGFNNSMRGKRDSGTYRGEKYMSNGSRSSWHFRTFAVQARAHNCYLVNNTMFASVRAKDAICDSIRDSCGGLKPQPPEEGGASADVPLFLSLYRDHATLYRDMSGISLHRRGYRDVMHRASLNEAIAAGILSIAGWNPRISGFGVSNERRAEGNNMALLDPMCGSGTFLIEAALMACNRAPGLMRRHWAFQTWHDFDEKLWNECKSAAVESVVSPPKELVLLGNDIHEGAVSLCSKDAKSAGVDHLINLSCNDCEDYIPPINPGLVVVNPPWGGRLGSDRDEPENVLPIWQGLGSFLKKRCNNADVYALSGNPLASRGLHMKSNKKWPITVGGLECKLLHYYVLPPKQNKMSSSETVLEMV